LTDIEIASIIERNGLQRNSQAGKVYYDNQKIKNLSQQNGILIRIGTAGNLKMEGSLHKYRNEIAGDGRYNYNLFTMSSAKDAVYRLLREKGIGAPSLRLTNYEIGVNLHVTKDCRAYLDRMTGIGVLGNKKDIIVNPRYGDKRERVTEFPDRVRKYYKAYDKGYESREKKRKTLPGGNILRIETVNRRLDNCFLVDFFAAENLRKLIDIFFRDWRTLRFERDIVTPKGTGRARQRLCMDIMNKGKDAVWERAKEQHANGSLSEWEYRNIREFICREWDTMKSSVSFIQGDEEREFRQLLDDTYTLLRNDEII
jgi:hypothetical protein